ncbi:toll/interleukin-1 receptor domain-containing protein [Actinoplanes sp. NEAU-A12]|uniref:Toll/interleukin-1 receptor domain-containing protein n=1 Tax=Actinoplanes sandaracinus TaxID=3045177 RepID=A0ABT6WEH7_9ACTN|nr:toll/interleukin-1 receptor domain-containing protein [Actinoplanes sandaracinus]MDI6098102.1 toll/interleukin-1 receptor domain-containing protein [Actinoplanes sandaracinus]
MPVIVSHAAADEPWAQWIALTLRAAGYETHLDPAGDSFARRLTEGHVSSTDAVLILLSAEHRASEADWAWIVRSPALVGRLLALRLDTAEPPSALRAIPCRSLHGLDEEDALEVVLTLVGGIRRHPSECPSRD